MKYCAVLVGVLLAGMVGVAVGAVAPSRTLQARSTRAAEYQLHIDLDGSAIEVTLNKGTPFESFRESVTRTLEDAGRVVADDGIKVRWVDGDGVMNAVSPPPLSHVASAHSFFFK